MPLLCFRWINWKEVMWRSTKAHTYPTPYMLCRFSCVWLFVMLWTVACQAALSMRFPRQQSWSGLPCPLPQDLLDPGIELTSPALADGFTTAESLGKLCPTPGSDKDPLPQTKGELKEMQRGPTVFTWAGCVCVCGRAAGRQRTEAPTFREPGHALQASQLSQPCGSFTKDKTQSSLPPYVPLSGTPQKSHVLNFRLRHSQLSDPISGQACLL